MELRDIYPHVADALASHVKDWYTLASESRNAWIDQALSNIEDGRDDIEVYKASSVSGSTVVINLTDAILSTIRDAAADAAKAQAHLERMVAMAFRSPVSTTAIADAAGVTRQTVYRWSQDQ